MFGFQESPHLIGREPDIGGPNRLVRVLGRLPRLEDVGLAGKVVFPVFRLDISAGRGDGLGRQAHGIRPHIGDEADVARFAP